MDRVEIEKIETEEGVAFSLTEAGRIAAKGPAPAVDRALARILIDRGEVAALLRERQGLPDPAAAIVTREVSPNVPSLAIQRANYITWTLRKSTYYQPTEQELDTMFSVLEEGDEILPDFARSFSVRKPDGRIISVDRKGRIGQPSPYGPAAKMNHE